MRRLFFLTALFLTAACTVRPVPECESLPLISALENDAWAVSEWISVADAPAAQGWDDQGSLPGASWFLSTVTNAKKVKKAVWMTSGLGVYELFLNGERVGREVLKPGFTHYAKTRRSFTYDLTPVLDRAADARNILSAQVTPGWWADKIVAPGGFFGKHCAFRGVLELTYSDGTVERLGTDTTHWKAGIAGPVVHAGIYAGVDYDARIPLGFETPEKLGTPVVNTDFPGEIIPTCGAEVYLREDLRLRPVRMYVWQGVSGNVWNGDWTKSEYGKVVVLRDYSDGDTVELAPGETLVVDFGQNAAAVPSFFFRADEGTVLECLPSEILNDGNGAETRGMDGPEGSTHRRNLRLGPDQIRLRYTFGASDGFVSFRPRASFWGYRYISLTASAPVQFQAIASIPVSSLTAALETGTLTTGNELVNKLISNTLWGMRSNYLSVPTDCPQRNERQGWMADTQVFAETGSFFADTAPFFHKFARDMRDSQSETGGFPGVSPAGLFGAETMRLGWADAGVIVPWTVWKQFGDKDIVEENWDAMERFITHVADTKYDHAALVEENGNYQWADWLSYEPLETCEGLAFENAESTAQAHEYWSYLGGCYWAMDAVMMRDMALDTRHDAARYAAMEKEAIGYLRDRFLNPDGSFKLPVLNTMQTPALFALKLGLVEGPAKEALCERLRRNIEDHGNCLQTGFLGTSILMQTLTENGMADVAYDLLFQRKNPSWLYSVDNGATTIWERWNSYMADKGMGPRGMNSFNHYAYGCVCQWLWESAAGIAADPSVPGFRHIVLKPVPDKRLGHLEATYKSAAGLIKSAWKYEGDVWEWTFTIPKGASATVTLPGESDAKDYKAGTYTVVL